MSVTVSANDWAAYIQRLSALNEKAAQEMRDYVAKHGFYDMNALIDFAYALATKYGEGAAALSAAMYDAIAELSGKLFDPAIPAETASYQQVAKTVQGVAKVSRNPEEMGGAVGRLVKQAGADTTLQNALRDGAEFAWVPSGDTCAFCITLASRGWQRASKKAIKGGHAEHIHSNCDCTYAIRFDKDSGVAGYDPEKYLRMYESADGSTPKEKINAMRRDFYAENKEEVNAQKRSAYKKRQELNSSAAEEVNVAKTSVGSPVQFDAKISDDPKYKGAVDLIGNLTSEYNSRLERVTVGAERAAGDVDVSGERMRLNSSQGTVVLHEFAHTLAGTAADKFGLTNDQEFWKDVRKIMRQYHKDVDATQDVTRWISTYEHSSRNVDEFMAEAFAHAKAKELGLEIPKKYGSDFTYSRQVLETVNKYFKKK